jgi:two-component system OmpR family sensor kinase
MESHHSSTGLRWYRSLYWRIGFGFLALIIGLLAVQSLMFSYLVSRSRETLPGGSPNRFAALVAADVASALARTPGLDLHAYLRDQYGAILSRVYVVMKDGRVAGNSGEDLPEQFLDAAAIGLGGIEGRAERRPEDLSGPPIVMVPIEVGSALRGLVVVPPRWPGRGAMWDVGRPLSVPGLLLLLVATGGAAALIIRPARRRLSDLESVTARLGSGDLSARASDLGGDEVARLARAFNRMAEDLAARDRALQVSDTLRRQMLADVSHELKTPLTSMRGYLETLRMPDVSLDPATRERYLDTIEQETRRLERIVRDLLDLARYENGVASIQTRVFAIERVFDHVVQRYEREAAERKIRLRAEVDPTADQIDADPDRIEQVIDNLVANALRHTPPGGSVDLRATTEPGSMRLTVTDSGGGIPAAHLPHVFDRFYKVDEARSNSSGGSGLGLSITKAIVTQHGGTIRISSVPGRTSFDITLPLHSASANL